MRFGSSCLPDACLEVAVLSTLPMSVIVSVVLDGVARMTGTVAAIALAAGFVVGWMAEETVNFSTGAFAVADPALRPGTVQSNAQLVRGNGTAQVLPEGAEMLIDGRRFPPLDTRKVTVRQRGCVTNDAFGTCACTECGSMTMCRR